ncbi:hypothetical protein [Kitasatospora purpeofusca]|uniref:hypothetical protein n=1 Tax=Kitasatospora purpeofusca TaxID=67352 RepID=UPI002A599B5A|nr:hypothetical protein [Kitasatospora purpeofusca]MDY0811920.1 hypothetical protein [Kitasatospora purpeofusca]
MHKKQTAPFIGAAFGLAFVLANAAALPAAVGVLLRVLAILAFLRLLLALRRRPAGAGTGADTDGGAGATGGEAAAPLFGRGYRLVVAAEVAVGLVGLVVINPVLHAPKATVGWIALVVGLHFFGLAAVWRQPSLNALAAAMSGCGAAGLALAATGVPAAVVATVAGILPGALLLGAVARSLRAPVAGAVRG